MENKKHIIHYKIQNIENLIINCFEESRTFSGNQGNINKAPKNNHKSERIFLGVVEPDLLDIIDQEMISMKSEMTGFNVTRQMAIKKIISLWRAK